MTPLAQVGPAPAEVRAFRVDVTDQLIQTDSGEKDHYVLKEVSLLFGDCLSPQVNVAIDYGWFAHFIALSYHQHTQHTMMVRLYRPGWQTVEIGSWGLPGGVIWKQASTIAEQENAIDDVVTTWERDAVGHLGVVGDAAPEDCRVFRCLSPGSASRAHREALLFAATEYERLARLAQVEGAVGTNRERLGSKAVALRELAAK